MTSQKVLWWKYTHTEKHWTSPVQFALKLFFLIVFYYARKLWPTKKDWNKLLYVLEKKKIDVLIKPIVHFPLPLFPGQTNVNPATGNDPHISMLTGNTTTARGSSCLESFVQHNVPTSTINYSLATAKTKTSKEFVEIKTQWKRLDAWLVQVEENTVICFI